MQTAHRHTAHHLHATRVILFGALLLSLFLVRVQPKSFAVTPSHGAVLAYATSISQGDLLNATNTARQQNGLAPLSLEPKLNQSSQNKALHMINNNYWSHVAPDGTQPWYFFQQAGYNYTNAGENLAYGFDTSQSIVDAWMNSAGHRANILGSYRDVGFGYANGPSYQGGENTVVVAHYGTPQASQPAPQPAPATTAPTPPAASPSTQQPVTEAPVPSEAPSNVPTTPAPTTQAEPSTSAEAKNQSPASPVPESQASSKNLNTPAAQSVGFLEYVRSYSLPLAAGLGVLLFLTSLAGYGLTHRALMQHAVASGEHFVVTHPIVDTAVVATVAALILTTTIGRIG